MRPSRRTRAKPRRHARPPASKQARHQIERAAQRAALFAWVVGRVDKPQAAPKIPIVPDAAPTVVHPHDETPAMVKPSRMLSEKVLAAPRSRKAKKELATLAPAEQIEQLCGMEAIAQVGAWSKDLKPGRVIAYAMADPKMSGNIFTTDGAALHSKKDWYRLRFKCDLSSDYKKVAAFEFLMGDPIPKKDLEEHNRPSESRSLD